MSERRTRPSLTDALEAIPVFPLASVVLFPESALPLHVFEPRYSVMLKDCLATHGAIAVAQLLGTGDDGQPEIARVSGGGIIIEHVPLSDGRSNIVVLGQARLRFDEIFDEEPPRFPYRRANARVLHDRDVSVSETDRTGLVAAATMFAAAVQKHDPGFSFRLPAAGPIGQLADVCAYQLVVDASRRQTILEELDPRARVQMVIDELAMQHSAMLREAGGVLN